MTTITYRTTRTYVLPDASARCMDDEDDRRALVEVVMAELVARGVL